MKSDKIGISLPAELAEQIRDAARSDRVSLSAWVADAVAARLRAEALAKAMAKAMAAWQREHGPLTREELEEARQESGLSQREPVA